MICPVCLKEFKVEQQGSGGRNREYCYDCLPTGLERNDRNRVRTSLLTQRARNHKRELGCSVCGYNRNGSALEWHHEKDDKLGNPSNLLKRSWPRYLEESKKCILLCSNCHRELHNP